MSDTKMERVEIEHAPHNPDYSHTPKGYGAAMRTKADELGIWQSLRKNRLVALIAMGAAFSAALDGYRKYRETAFTPVSLI